MTRPSPIGLFLVAALLAGCASKTEVTPAQIQNVHARKQDKG